MSPSARQLLHVTFVADVVELRAHALHDAADVLQEYLDVIRREMCTQRRLVTPAFEHNDFAFRRIIDGQRVVKAPVFLPRLLCQRQLRRFAPGRGDEGRRIS